jgi:HYR domain
MNQYHTIRLSSWARLVGLALLLGVGLLASLGLTSRTAHAQPAATSIVSTCDVSHLSSAIGNAASGDTITFGCSGTITVGSPLGIHKNLTLDGSGQQVTLSGGGSAQVLVVDSGVSFTLNALTVADGYTAGSGSGSGGGLDNEGGTVSISNSTFANNLASDGGGLYNSGTVSISNSILVGNTSDDCFGGVSDQGYNLEGATSCGFTGTGDLQKTDAKLDPSRLQNNGGPTQTIALLASSPAIDHIPAANCPATDQRGVSRLPGERCDIGAFEFPDTTPPTLQLPSPITVDATGPQGAVVSYTATATDDDGDALTPTCAPASGSTFPIGTTTVNCSASEPGSATATGSFQVVVKDVTPPVLSLPSSPITVDATSPQGASVTYTVTATDPDNPSSQLTITCLPASGSTFSIGTTTVNCTASDPSGNSSSGSFQVVVNGAATQISDLLSLVNSFGLPADIQAGFDTQLQAVQTDLTNNNPAQACSDLTAFINHVQAQSGKHLTTSQATQLLSAAKQVQAVLGC